MIKSKTPTVLTLNHEGKEIDVYSVADAATVLEKSRQRIYQLIESGTLTEIKGFGKVYIPVVEIKGIQIKEVKGAVRVTKELNALKQRVDRIEEVLNL